MEANVRHLWTSSMVRPFARTSVRGNGVEDTLMAAAKMKETIEGRML
jgi:hypothetical protein